MGRIGLEPLRLLVEPLFKLLAVNLLALAVDEPVQSGRLVDASFGEETHDVLWVRKQLDVLFKLVDPSVELELEGDSKLFHSRRPVEECLEVLGVVSLVDVHDERWLLPLHHDEHVEGLLFASQSVIGVRGDTGDSVERRQHLTELLEDLELVMAIRVEHQHQLLERFKGCSLQSVVMIVR